MRLTREVVHAGRTKAGGWTRRQLELIGVPWPPKSGWVGRVAGREVPQEVVNEFLRLGGAVVPAREARAARRRGRHDARVKAGSLIEVERAGGELIRVKPAVAEALNAEPGIRSAAAARDMDCSVSISQCGMTSTAQFMFDSWASGERALDWWPGNGKWRRPDTGETGTEDDWRKVVEIAAGKK